MRLVLPLLTVLVLAAGCAEAGDQSSDLVNTEKAGSKSQKWIYEGPLPAIESPAIVASLKGHTVRVTGLLPKGFGGELPFYARSSAEPGGRTRVTVVYPIATGATDPQTGKAPMAPGHYGTLWGIPFTPTNDKAAWGGFPFLQYNSKRGLAFHGPITSQRNADTGDWEWTLIRGPVSHGCQRMQGEHVVELAHLLGMKMDAPHKAGESKAIKVSVDVTTEWDAFEGKWVDVAYPAAAGVQRPKTNVEMFQTWDSRNLPNLVCAYDPSRALDGSHCDDVGEVLQDLSTGELLYEVTEGAWIGSACQADADCGFEVAGEGARCLTGAGGGFCTVSCEGYCPDQPGAAATFCGKSAGAGACMSKAALENNGCADLPGTKAKQVERFVGSSGASQKVATVCSF